MFRRCSLILLFLVISLAAKADQKKDLLRKLRIVQENYNIAITEVNKLMISHILATQTVHISPKKEKQSQQNLDSTLRQIEQLRYKNSELKQRIYLLDRLIFLVDSKFSNGQNPKTFFAQQILDLAYTEFINSTSNTLDSKLGSFLIYLSVAIREIHNPHEDIIGFIESYIAYSTLTEPKSPFQFLRDGNYINGSQVQTANPIPKEEVGEAWEEQVKKMGASELAPDLKLYENRIGLTEIFDPPSDPIPTHTIFDKNEYSNPLAPNPSALETPFKLEYEGYSLF